MIGEKLKQLRIKNNLKQSDLARILDVTQGAVGMYENDKRTPSPELIVKLAEYFNVTTDYLLGHTKPTIQSVQIYLVCHQSYVKIIPSMIYLMGKKTLNL